MGKFMIYVVQDFVSSLQPDVGRGFLHVSNVFLFLSPGLFGWRDDVVSYVCPSVCLCLFPFSLLTQ